MISLDLFHDFVRGPLALSAFLIFFTGTAYQVLRFFYLSQKIKKTTHNPFRLSPTTAVCAPPVKSTARRISFFKGTIAGVHPVMTVITSLFHTCLIAAPLFLLGHNNLIDESWGISFFSLPEGITDIMTVMVIGCSLFFLFRRIFSPRVRSITTLSDYLILLLTAMPFITGFLAFHQTTAYKPMIILHMLSGEIMLILLPFTKLVHMLFFFINRFLIPHENSFGRGTRTWYFGGPKFSFKRWYFGKKKFDIDNW
ncbi:Nitrate reductase gamma subunit [Desulfocicer vacuolatum DSM 3385]|uniref:Nitrate reductase gamma subunit n=1 Tax=Desulfocicer vacuolatum DSM 3385 TaxID=1121400 RepID=A0A1W2BRE0_9BACT|nr:hypothetical protein [Desulfocicer vacuolatum]SMC75294.1 Nitrate reductase gamma subunit [Desulfocicer vacuolatum DSM 3385]